MSCVNEWLPYDGGVGCVHIWSGLKGSLLSVFDGLFILVYKFAMIND